MRSRTSTHVLISPFQGPNVVQESPDCDHQGLKLCRDNLANNCTRTSLFLSSSNAFPRRGRSSTRPVNVRPSGVRPPTDSGVSHPPHDYEGDLDNIPCERVSRTTSRSATALIERNRFHRRGLRTKRLVFLPETVLVLGYAAGPHVTRINFCCCKQVFS